jgi:hypothetical protein
VDEAIGIIGQAVLILVGLACLAALVFFILLMIRASRRIVRELRQPTMPPTDAYIPHSFDRLSGIRIDGTPPRPSKPSCQRNRVL